MRIECDGAVFVYTGDTNEIENLDRFAENADLLLADAGLSSADWKLAAPHLSAAGCGRLARSASVKRLLLTHAYEPKREAALAAARAGLTIPVDWAIPGNVYPF